MGQSGSNSLARHSDILRDYQLQAKNEESGLTFLSHRETRDMCLLRETAHHDFDQFQKSMKELRMRMEFRGEGVLRLLRLQSEELESICSKIFKIYMLWEYGNLLLSDEINSRGLERRPFEHSRIITLLRDICKGLSYFYRNGITYNCLTTKTIISTSGSFKLIDPLMLTLQRNLQSVFNNRNIKNIYLSPEQCTMIELEYNQRSNEKDAVFTAGMIVLQAATLERKNNCYIDRCSRVDWKCVQINVNMVGSRYGADLAAVLREMLRPQAKDRISLSELLRKIDGLSQQLYIKTQGNESTNSNRPVTARQSYSTIAHCSIASNLIPSEAIMHSTLHIHKSNHNSLPQRMFQTTHRPISTPTQSKISPITLKPPALQEMKTINTTTEIIKEQPAIFSNQLSTAKTNQFQRGNFDNLAYSPQQFSPFNTKQINTSTGSSEQPRSDSRIIIHKYQHSEKKHPLQQYCVDEFNKGSRYEGFKFNGRRDGWGKFNFQDGGLYEGEWRQNKMHGFGSLYYPSGKLAYEGQWVMDEFQGIGKLYNESYKKLNTPFDFQKLTDIQDYWVTYQGTFKHDVKVGRGILKLSNGQSFEGNFQNDEIHGQGTYLTMQGNRIRGLWHHCILQTIYQSC